MAKLQEVDAALRSEYALRRRMLIERVKVTLQSFLWSPRLEQTVRRRRRRPCRRCCQTHNPRLLREAPPAARTAFLAVG